MRTAIAVASAVLLPAAAESQTRWSVDPTPIVDIAGTSPNGDLRFEHVVGGARLSNGNIVLADQDAAMLRIFNPRGQQVTTVGRRGNGPNEFQMLFWLGQCAADTVFAWDFRLRRLTVVASSGTIARQHAIPRETGSGSPPFTLSCSRTGRYVFVSRPARLSPTPDGPPFLRGTITLSIANADGVVTDSVSGLPGSEMAAIRDGAGSFRPLGHRTHVAVSRELVFVGTSDSASIDVYGPDGRRRNPIALQLASRSPARDHVEQGVDASLILAPAAVRAGVRDALLALPMPKQLVPYTALFTDPDDVLWIVLSSPGDPHTDLRAVSSTGQVLADVRIPVWLTVFEIGRDYILGAYEDANDEPHVALYRLRRGS